MLAFSWVSGAAPVSLRHTLKPAMYVSETIALNGHPQQSTSLAQKPKPAGSSSVQRPDSPDGLCLLVQISPGMYNIACPANALAVETPSIKQVFSSYRDL